MAEIREFGTAPDQMKDGYRGIKVVDGTDKEVLEQFPEDDVRLVRGPILNSSANRYEFFVMVKGDRQL